MVYKAHYIELYVNGNKVDLESQKSLNLRFQSVLYDPSKITSTQADYSFEFSLPSTPINDKIFDYANNLSKLNKYHARWNAEVYADGTLIFEGSLTLNGYKDKMYKCNLVSIKVYSLEDIFGDAVMTDIPWEIPFDGAGTSGYTIDHYNSQSDTDVVFPLVSYGVFEKSSINGIEDDYKEYTSKFDIDKYNRWYVESFYPSFNMLATIKKAFEYKGYYVAGDAFQNVYLKDIFMSTNLADGQSPDYNLGNPKFGSVSLASSMSTYGKAAYNQELKFPYFKVQGQTEISNLMNYAQTEYNLSSIELYDVLADGSVTVDSPSYMYQPYEHLVVIPADGFYKIEMSVASTLDSSGNIEVTQHLYNGTTKEFSEGNVQLPVGFNENTPIEVALVRNYEDNYELIKGKNNKYYRNGNPNDETCKIGSFTYPNAVEWPTCFPHEDAYNSTLPTKQNDLTLYNTQGTRLEDGSVSSLSSSGRRESTTRGSTISGHQAYGGGSGNGKTFDGNFSNSRRKWTEVKYGYVYDDGEIMAYDRAVSDSFICGFSSFYGGVASVMKNGYSWSKSIADENQAFYPEIGYSLMKKDATNGSRIYEHSNLNYNKYINTPISYVNSNNTALNGYISCMVYLKKNDVLKVLEVHRGYKKDVGDETMTQRYYTTTNVQLKVTAASPRSYYDLNAVNYAYNSPTEFDVNLQLSNFLNKETKISDWIQNVIDAYNLEFTQDGNSVYLDTKKKFYRNIPIAVDIDDRANSEDAETERIDYPSSMAVRYKIDTEEWGFEKSVTPQSKLNDTDWKDYGDSGFTVINLNDDSYETTTSDKTLQFSYTWYDDFKWYEVDSGFNQSESATTVNLRIPVISKYSYMIDGYNYEESMKHDGYGFPQRFWFRPKATTSYVWTRTYPAEIVHIYEPKNLYTNNSNIYLNLSYKTTEPSLLEQFFNVTPYLSSNYVIVDVYLTPDEFKMIKNGAMVHFDSDLYIPVSIEGYDPSGGNPTTLKMIKKV